MSAATRGSRLSGDKASTRRKISWADGPFIAAVARAQTPFRALGIEIAFGREGRAGKRIIKMSASRENQPRKTVSTVSTVSTVIDDAPPGS
jgi:hypothetical protein